MRLTLSSFIAACALAGGASVARSALRAGEGEAAGTFALGKVVGSSSHIRRTTERGQQLALQGQSGWLDLSRGLNREVKKDGVITSHISDETTNRGFWNHYLKVMEAA